MPKAYLTIDDSPSSQTDDLVDALSARNIPALLFCRGDRLAENPASIMRAIQKGFILGNHAWSHTRFSQLSLEAGIKEIETTEKFIDAAYMQAGVARACKYFRFPHLDRGCGGWVVDYDAIQKPADRDALVQLFGTGLNIQQIPPSAADREKKRALQDYLWVQGFRPPNFSGIRHSWYVNTEIAEAVDSLFTYSTADWMLTPRHAGKWPYQTLDDLKAKIDDDPFLAADSAHIILAHDQEDLFEVVIPLLDHLIAKGFTFSHF